MPISTGHESPFWGAHYLFPLFPWAKGLMLAAPGIILGTLSLSRTFTHSQPLMSSLQAALCGYSPSLIAKHSEIVIFQNRQCDPCHLERDGSMKRKVPIDIWVKNKTVATHLYYIKLSQIYPLS